MAKGKRTRRPNTGAGKGTDGPSGTVIRKYPNRRLYNTATGTFVTLDDLRRMVVAGEPFVVEDAREGKDITASILAQIIAEQEGRGESILPGELMRKLIAFYDSGLSKSFIDYLQMSMDTFTKNMPPLAPYGEFSQRNMDMMRKSFDSFFGAMAPKRSAETAENPEKKGFRAPGDGSGGDEAIDRLREQLNDMQDQINRLKGKPTRRNP